MKKIFAFCIALFCITSLTFAQFSLKDFSFKDLSLSKVDVGGNLGTNMNSRTGWALAFGCHGDYEIMENLKVGLQLGMSHDFSEIFVFEPYLYGKYYFPSFTFFNITPFAEANLGASIINTNKTYGSLLVGIGAGVHYELGKVYFEPKITWGYPFMMAINVAVGYSF